MSILDLIDRPIAFQRSFVKLGIGVTGALMLSQAVYWQKRCSNGWFYKTQEEWEEETGLTRHEQDSVRKKLRAMGIFEEKKQGIPCRVFYRINVDALQSCLLSSGIQVCHNPANCVAEDRQSNTETTTENTTDTLPASLAKEILDLYHEILHELPAVQVLSDKRKKAIRARWKTSANTQSLNWWRDFFEQVKDTPFLMGKNDRKWRADLDFLMTESKFISIIEGKYDGCGQ